MNRLSRFDRARNYALYYGPDREEDLARFDIAVVEAGDRDRASVSKIQETGALAIAYLSVMEIPPAAPETRVLKKEDFLNKDGDLIQNVEYGNYMADLRSINWTGMLLQKAGRLLIRDGYDGLFLDTIGNVESPVIPDDIRDLQLVCAVKIVEEIRTAFPEHIIIQNSGLEKLCFYTAKYVNGICWENPPFKNESNRAWINAVTGHLINLRKQHGIRVLILSEADSEEDWESPAAMLSNFQLGREIAAQNEFLWYGAPYRYVKGINLSGAESFGPFDKSSSVLTEK